MMALWWAALALGQAPAVEDLPAFDAQLYRPAMDGERTLWTRDAGLAPSMAITGRVLVDVFSGSLSTTGDDGTLTRVVDDVVGLDAMVAWHPGRFRLGLHAPVYGLVGSDLDVGGAGLGDLRVDARGVLLDPRESLIGVALASRVGLPTGTSALPLRSQGLTWALDAVVDHRHRDLSLLGNLGFEGVPGVEVVNLKRGAAATFSTAVGYRVHPNGGFAVEVFGKAALGVPVWDVSGSPVEGMASGWWRLSDRMVLRGGLGTGLTTAPSASTFRMLLGLGFEPRRDSAVMAEPLPEPPPTVGRLALRASSEDGALADATWRVGDLEGMLDNGALDKDLVPGTWLVVVDAPGHRTTGVSVDIRAGATTELELVLEPVRVKVTLERIEIAERVYFDTNEATIQSESYDLLNEVAATLADRTDIVRVRVEGHTDSRGEEDFNLDLSRRRAHAVRNYLLATGLLPERLVYEGYGESMPLEQGETEAAWQRNRRVEFHIEEWAEEPEP